MSLGSVNAGVLPRNGRRRIDVSRILIKTIPYSKVNLDDMVYAYPGLETETDADNQVVRIYKLDSCRDPVERMFGIGKTRIER